MSCFVEITYQVTKRIFPSWCLDLQNLLFSSRVEMELLGDKSDDFGQRKSSGTHHSKSQSQMPYNLRKRTRKKDWDCGATNKKAKQKRTTPYWSAQNFYKIKNTNHRHINWETKKDPAKNESTKSIREKQTFLIETCQEQPTGECSHRKETKAKEIKTHSPEW